MPLTHTVQIVTGAGSGLGCRTAERFAKEGAKVICADLDMKTAEKTASTIRTAGGEALALEVDVADWTSTQEMAEAALKHYGRIDGAYANAGLPGAGSALDVALETWSRTLSVNLTGAMLTARAVIPAMIESGRGAILFTASNSALKAFPNQAAYAASKGGVISLARQMSLDFAKHGIRVNSICPGMVVTPLVEDMYRKREEFTGVPMKEALEATAARYPMGRTGTPDDIAAMAAFLQSDEASWITGQAFTVDGGISA
ncbi:SDR family NAD(P)-dependent oxidoreductase [Paenarthrobacter sp. NPDC057981]|uniref:SDR family NAD(P)-dependent oxidoreductase n=1 Tax=Paenarthrobacter sp. NPDC057981 TaxID=3346297 RepID=UPI0036DE5167